MVGVVERVLYTASWQLGKPEFIAVWLALKVAGQWRRWTDDMCPNGPVVPGRTIFNVFLIGNALSIAYGSTGGLLIKWLNMGACLRALVIGTALVLGTLLLNVWVKSPRWPPRWWVKLKARW